MRLTSRARRASTVATGGIALALTLAACGGGSSGGSDQVNAQGTGSGSSAVVATHSGPLGTYLTDGSGRTLYIFAADTSSKSTCNGACTSEWPPLTTKGTPTTSGGATASMVATSARSDGTTQVTYAGHPLYYYSNDGSTGDMNGQGKRDFGGLWTAAGTDGSALTKQSGSSGGSTSPTESSNGWG
jgi:predicted lipoprotein with Yx(FWY)xxD motif